MLYHILIAIAYLLGVAYDALNKVGRIRRKVPNLDFKHTWRTFFSEEWNTLMVSFLGWVTVQIAWFVIHYNGVQLPLWIEQWGIFPIALFAGYGLQRLIYRYLGSFENVLEERAKSLNKMRVSARPKPEDQPEEMGGPGGSSNPPGDSLPPPPPPGGGGQP